MQAAPGTPRQYKAVIMEMQRRRPLPQSPYKILNPTMVNANQNRPLPIFLNDLNSKAFPEGSEKNIVRCSPDSISNRIHGPMMLQLSITVDQTVPLTIFLCTVAVCEQYHFFRLE